MPLIDVGGQAVEYVREGRGEAGGALLAKLVAARRLALERIPES